MATYYVRPDGNDTNTGLAPTNAAGTGAWRTVNKALSVAVGGDTVWIAPGVYRENVLPTVAVQSSMIYVTGDPTLTQVAWGAGLTAGIIRITNNLTNDTGTPSGITLSLVSKAYYTIANIRFDGNITVNNARELYFNRCQFYGYGEQSNFGNSIGTTANFTYNKIFDQCVFVDMPVLTSNAYLGSSTAVLNLIFTRCLFYVCNNATNGNAAFYYPTAVGATRIANAVVVINCTIVAGKDIPSYLYYADGGAYNPETRASAVFVNNLILVNPSVVTFYSNITGAGGTVTYEAYNAGYSITRNGVGPGTSDITLKYSGSDNLGAYRVGFSNYLMYSPTDDSPLRGAGTTYTQVGIPQASSPSTDYAGNPWKQTNPTIGYLENGNVAPVASTGGYVPLDRAVQTITTTAGSTGVSVHIYLGSTGVTFQTPNLTCYYARDNGASVQIPLVQGNASTWVSGGLFEVSSTTMPGVYKFDIPNAVIQAGAKSASIMLRGANAFNGAFVNVNIEAEPQPNYVSTNEFKLKSEDAGYNNVLELNANTATTVKLQLLDMYQTPTNLAGSTLSVEVYNSTNNLVATYTPTVRYAGNGEITFVISTTVTATYGDYNVYCVKTTGATDSVVYGPLALKVRRL